MTSNYNTTGTAPAGTTGSTTGYGTSGATTAPGTTAANTRGNNTGERVAEGIKGAFAQGHVGCPHSHRLASSRTGY